MNKAISLARNRQLEASFNCSRLSGLGVQLVNVIDKLGHIVENEQEEEGEYMYNEAAIYVIVVLLCYSMAVICLIFITTKENQLQYVTDDDIYNGDTAETMFGSGRNSDGENVKREALESLRNPAFRKKMWDIYMQNPNTYKMKTIELKKIQNIDKKLKNYTYKPYSTMSALPQHRKSMTPSPTPRPFLLKDMNIIDEYVANLHMNGSTSSVHPQPWWTNQAEWHGPENVNSSTVNSNQRFNNIGNGHSTVTNIDASLLMPPASRFRIEKFQDHGNLGV